MATNEKTLNTDSIIQRLLEVRKPNLRENVPLKEDEIRALCTVSSNIFLGQPVLLELTAPLKICGDIHGQYCDLLHIFAYQGFPPESNYLFLGNYVDYGKQSIETFCLLLAYKIKYPENFFLLRGIHECASKNRIYGFYDECKRRYSLSIWRSFVNCFNCLPIAAIVSNKIFCCHSGLSPNLQSMDQIRRILRPTDIPLTGLLSDLLRANHSRDTEGWGVNNNEDSDNDDDEHESSFSFGAQVISRFLRENDFDLICRGHQIVEDGYEFFAQRQLVTIFSAPNFRCEYDNAAAIMSVDEELMCSFSVLKPTNVKLKTTPDDKHYSSAVGHDDTSVRL